MIQFFDKDYTGAPFQFFGAAHILAMLVVVLLNLYLLRFKKANETTRRNVRYILAAVLWANEIGWHLWNYFTGPVDDPDPASTASLLGVGVDW